jgi:hypothetical protein
MRLMGTNNDQFIRVHPRKPDRVPLGIRTFDLKTGDWSGIHLEDCSTIAYLRMSLIRYRCSTLSHIIPNTYLQ